MQPKPVSELSEIFSEVSDVLEAAAATSCPQKGRAHLIQGLEQLRERMNIPASSGRKSDGIDAGSEQTLHLSGCTMRFGFTAAAPPPLFSSQGRCKLSHCPPPSVTCFTGKKTTLVNCRL